MKTIKTSETMKTVKMSQTSQTTQTSQTCRTKIFFKVRHKKAQIINRYYKMQNIKLFKSNHLTLTKFKLRVRCSGQSMIILSHNLYFVT